MSASRVFAARLAGCSVFDPAGDTVGRVRDALEVYRQKEPPRVVGLLVEVRGKRRVFRSIRRVMSFVPGRVITAGLITLRRFEQRGGEVRKPATKEFIPSELWVPFAELDNQRNRDTPTSLENTAR